MKNYKLLEKKNLLSMGIEVYLYEHIKTKASIVYVKSDDKNKTFAIGFKTPPANSKGMAHIMEHSVLNGSKKYKTKEPFMDMVSSSLQTFLNAMTYPDKTVYPVSSENDKDFYNLTDVYLDAVFNPRILEKEEIFLQEGWHYEIKEDGSLDISGVVYNEMKGALTDPDTLIYNDLIAYLYKGSPYQYVSGGDPFEIPKLSYDEFLDFYHKYYHPSNSRIYFYGDMDIEFYLDHLDREYLSNYDYKKIDADIEVLENKYEKIIENAYPAGKIEENSDYLSYAFMANDIKTIKDSITVTILLTVLFNLDSSEISNRIYKEIGPESFFARKAYGKRAAVIIQAQKTSKENLDKFVEIIEDGIKKASKSISKHSLKAAFSILDFSLRDQMNSTSRGLEYFLMSSFDSHELDSFKIVEYLDELKELIDTDYYEKFVEKYFLDNPTKLVMVSSPSVTYNEEKNKKLKEELDDFKASLSEKDFEEIKEKQKRFEAFQNRKDTEEEKATIPKLEISDVDCKIEKIPRLVEKEDFEFVFHDYDTAGMIYITAYFDLNDLSLEELKYAQVLSDFLAAVDTENYSYGQLDNEIWIRMGSFDASVFNIRIHEDEKESLDTNFKLSFKTTRDNLKSSLLLIDEILRKSKFDSKKRLLELLKQRKSVYEMSVYDSGHLLAMNRNLSHFDKYYYVKEELNGMNYYKFVKNLIKEVEEDFTSFKEKIQAVEKKIFTRNISFNICSSKNDYDFIKENLKETFLKLEDRKIEKVELPFQGKYYKEAILSDANVNYLSMGANLKEFGQSYNAKLSLATSILSNPYLYELIRAKGGAYGAGINIDRSLNLASYSYRDPNILKTIEAFAKIGDLTKNLKLSERDFTNQKISKMGSLIRPKSPDQKADLDYINYKKGKDQSEVEVFLEDIKNASLDDIRAYADLFQKAIEKENITVFGNREEILKHKDFFDNIIDLNE